MDAGGGLYTAGGAAIGLGPDVRADVVPVTPCARNAAIRACSESSGGEEAVDDDWLFSASVEVEL